MYNKCVHTFFSTIKKHNKSFTRSTTLERSARVSESVKNKKTLSNKMGDIYKYINLLERTIFLAFHFTSTQVNRGTQSRPEKSTRV